MFCNVHHIDMLTIIHFYTHADTTDPKDYIVSRKLAENDKRGKMGMNALVNSLTLHIQPTTWKLVAIHV